MFAHGGDGWELGTVDAGGSDNGNGSWSGSFGRLVAGFLGLQVVDLLGCGLGGLPVAGDAAGQDELARLLGIGHDDAQPDDYCTAVGFSVAFMRVSTYPPFLWPAVDGLGYQAADCSGSDGASLPQQSQPGAAERAKSSMRGHHRTASIASRHSCGFSLWRPTLLPNDRAHRLVYYQIADFAPLMPISAHSAPARVAHPIPKWVVVYGALLPHRRSWS